MRQINASAVLRPDSGYMSRFASGKPQFYVVELGLDHFDSSYALVRMAVPQRDRAGWRGFVERRLKAGGGLALVGGDGTLFGFLFWRVDERLRHGRVLAIDEFLTFELSRHAPGRRALCEAAERLGLELGCEALEIRLQAGDTQLPPRASAWTRLGHQVDALILHKPLVEAAAGASDAPPAIVASA